LKAHKWLVEIYEGSFKNDQKASKHRLQLTSYLKGERIICTEAVDQDEAAVLSFIKNLGHSIYDATKHKEKANHLYLNTKWLEEVEGQIIFIPSHSLSFLPDHYQYKLLYVQSEGDFSAQVKSGETLPKVLSTKKWEHFERERSKIEAWIESQANLSILYLNHEEMIQNKEEQGFIVDNFLKK